MQAVVAVVAMLASTCQIPVPGRRGGDRPRLFSSGRDFTIMVVFSCNVQAEFSSFDCK